MNTVCDTGKCTGCMACVDVCPKRAIHIEDSLREYNAVIDDSLCISCDLCHQVCQNHREAQYAEPIHWKQGWRKDPVLRAESSSGGAASALSEVFVREYGSVCSCVFKNGSFTFEFASTVPETGKFKGSKYVKSNPAGIYRPVKKKLQAGEKVLFIGLPCQVQALKLFVGEKLLPNLYTADLICHGSPSPGLLEQFLHEKEQAIGQIKHIAFRKNTKFHLYIDKIGAEPERVADTYTYAFLQGLDYTENCYSCRFACKQRISDLTIGDSWGSGFPEAQEQQGISLIMCQSQKGRELLEKTDLELFDVDMNAAVSNNKQLLAPSPVPPQREKFFRRYFKTGQFGKAVSKTYPWIFLKQKIKKVLLH